MCNNLVLPHLACYYLYEVLLLTNNLLLNKDDDDDIKFCFKRPIIIIYLMGVPTLGRSFS